jgi:hypothetical protein
MSNIPISRADRPGGVERLAWAHQRGTNPAKGQVPEDSITKVDQCTRVDQQIDVLLSTCHLLGPHWAQARVHRRNASAKRAAGIRVSQRVAIESVDLPLTQASLMGSTLLVIVNLPLVRCPLLAIAWYCLALPDEAPGSRPLPILSNPDPGTQSAKPSKDLLNVRKPLNGFFQAPCLRGDGGICPPWPAASGPGNPRMRVLQDPTQAIQTLAHLWPDSV